MKTISLNVQEPYLSLILNGIKTVEGRLNNGKFKDLSIGDVLLIGPDEIKFNIEKLSIYKSFRDMILNEGINNVIPNKTNIDDAESVYYNFYTKDQESEFGVVAIKIKKVN